ncbi:single-stranded DNA-binding protein [bacterium SCSIO 12741]|nr:single-stranded DNA-binding protein [bacterium SCSIO 12741]
MAGSVNKVILIGNLGKDPEVRYFEEGRGVANFPIATTETYKDKNGNRQEQTDWHNIVVWRPGLVGIVEQYLKKGNKVYVEGRLRTRSYEDQNNQTRYVTEVIVDNLTLLGGRNEENSSGGQPASSAPPGASQNISEGEQNTNIASDSQDDDLPF